MKQRKTKVMLVLAVLNLLITNAWGQRTASYQLENGEFYFLDGRIESSFTAPSSIRGLAVHDGILDTEVHRTEFGRSVELINVDSIRAQAYAYHALANNVELNDNVLRIANTVSKELGIAVVNSQLTYSFNVIREAATTILGLPLDGPFFGVSAVSDLISNTVELATEAAVVSQLSAHALASTTSLYVNYYNYNQLIGDIRKGERVRDINTLREFAKLSRRITAYIVYSSELKSFANENTTFSLREQSIEALIDLIPFSSTTHGNVVTTQNFVDATAFFRIINERLLRNLDEADSESVFNQDYNALLAYFNSQLGIGEEEPDDGGDEEEVAQPNPPSSGAGISTIGRNQKQQRWISSRDENDTVTVYGQLRELRAGDGDDIVYILDGGSITNLADGDRGFDRLIIGNDVQTDTTVREFEELEINGRGISLNGRIGNSNDDLEIDILPNSRVSFDEANITANNIDIQRNATVRAENLSIVVDSGISLKRDSRFFLSGNSTITTSDSNISIFGEFYAEGSYSIVQSNTGEVIIENGGEFHHIGNSQQNFNLAIRGGGTLILNLSDNRNFSLNTLTLPSSGGQIELRGITQLNHLDEISITTEGSNGFTLSNYTLILDDTEYSVSDFQVSVNNGNLTLTYNDSSVEPPASELPNIDRQQDFIIEQNVRVGNINTNDLANQIFVYGEVGDINALGGSDTVHLLGGRVRGDIDGGSGGADKLIVRGNSSYRGEISNFGTLEIEGRGIVLGGIIGERDSTMVVDIKRDSNVVFDRAKIYTNGSIFTVGQNSIVTAIRTDIVTNASVDILSSAIFTIDDDSEIDTNGSDVTVYGELRARQVYDLDTDNGAVIIKNGGEFHHLGSNKNKFNLTLESGSSLVFDLSETRILDLGNLSLPSSGGAITFTGLRSLKHLDEIQINSDTGGFTTNNYTLTFDDNSFASGQFDITTVDGDLRLVYNDRSQLNIINIDTDTFDTNITGTNEASGISGNDRVFITQDFERGIINLGSGDDEILAEPQRNENGLLLSLDFRPWGINGGDGEDSVIVRAGNSFLLGALTGIERIIVDGSVRSNASFGIGNDDDRSFSQDETRIDISIINDAEFELQIRNSATNKMLTFDTNGGDIELREGELTIDNSPHLNEVTILRTSGGGITTYSSARNENNRIQLDSGASLFLEGGNLTLGGNTELDFNSSSNFNTGGGDIIIFGEDNEIDLRAAVINTEGGSILINSVSGSTDNDIILEADNLGVSSVINLAGGSLEARGDGLELYLEDDSVFNTGGGDIIVTGADSRLELFHNGQLLLGTGDIFISSSNEEDFSLFQVTSSVTNGKVMGTDSDITIGEYGRLSVSSSAPSDVFDIGSGRIIIQNNGRLNVNSLQLQNTVHFENGARIGANFGDGASYPIADTVTIVERANLNIFLFGTDDDVNGQSITIGKVGDFSTDIRLQVLTRNSDDIFVGDDTYFTQVVNGQIVVTKGLPSGVGQRVLLSTFSASTQNVDLVRTTSTSSQAVSLGGGNDRFTIGSRGFTGSVDGGEGEDTVEVDTVQPVTLASSALTSIENLVVNGGSTLVITGELAQEEPTVTTPGFVAPQALGLAPLSADVPLATSPATSTQTLLIEDGSTVTLMTGEQEAGTGGVTINNGSLIIDSASLATTTNSVELNGGSTSLTVRNSSSLSTANLVLAGTSSVATVNGSDLTLNGNLTLSGLNSSVTFETGTNAVVNSGTVSLSNTNATLSLSGGVFTLNSTNISLTGSNSALELINGSFDSNGGAITASGFGSEVNIANALVMTDNGSITIGEGASFENTADTTINLGTGSLIIQDGGFLVDLESQISGTLNLAHNSQISLNNFEQGAYSNLATAISVDSTGTDDDGMSVSSVVNLSLTQTQVEGLSAGDFWVLGADSGNIGSASNFQVEVTDLATATTTVSSDFALRAGGSNLLVFYSGTGGDTATLNTTSFTEDGTLSLDVSLLEAGGATVENLVAIGDSSSLFSTTGTTISSANSNFQSLGEGESETLFITYDSTESSVTTARVVALTITGVNDAPTDIVFQVEDSGSSLVNTATGVTVNVAENVLGDIVSVSSVVDVDSNDTHTYSIILVNGRGAMANDFAIDSDGVVSIERVGGFDFETGSGTIDVTVQVNDGTASYTEVVAISLTDVIEEPVAPITITASDDLDMYDAFGTNLQDGSFAFQVTVATGEDITVNDSGNLNIDADIVVEAGATTGTLRGNNITITDATTGEITLNADDTASTLTLNQGSGTLSVVGAINGGAGSGDSLVINNTGSALTLSNDISGFDRIDVNGEVTLTDDNLNNGNDVVTANGESTTIINDINEALSVSGDLIFNGGMITSENQFFFGVITANSLIFNNGTIDISASISSTAGGAIRLSGDFVLNGGSLNYSVVGREVVTVSTGNVIINGGSIVAEAFSDNRGVVVQTGNVTINGGSISTTGRFGEAIDITTGNAIINGGNVSSSDPQSFAIRADNIIVSTSGAQSSISGRVEASGNLDIRSGVVTLSNGQSTANGLILAGGTRLDGSGSLRVGSVQTASGSVINLAG